MNQIISNLLDFHQKKIGSYDNHLTTEKAFEAIFLKNNFYCLSTKKSNRIEDQIDIDLIKGSTTYIKTKSRLSLPKIFLIGLKNLLLYPFYFNRWKNQTNSFFATVLLLAYFLQIINLLVFNYYSDIMIYNGKQIVTIAEILTPTMIMLSLCIMYTYITSALPVCSDKDENKVPTKQSTPDTQIIATRVKNTSVKKDKKIIELGIKTENIHKNDELEVQNTVKNLKKSSSSLFNDEGDRLYYSEDIGEEYDLNEVDLTDSDQNESNFLTEPSSPVKTNKKAPISSTKERTPTPTYKILRSNPAYSKAAEEKISCIMWDGNEWKGVDLSMIEITNYINKTVIKATYSLDYFYIGIVLSILIGLLPVYYPYYLHFTVENPATVQKIESNLLDTKKLSFLILTEPFSVHLVYEQIIDTIYNLRINIELKVVFVIMNTLISTITLGTLFFSVLTIADRTLNQRFLHAKYFCYLNSHRRAKKYNLPHFRLNKVENIKMWLSLRSFIKRRGPQRSIDAIISSAFFIGVLLCSVVCIRFLQDSEFLTESLLNWQLVSWCFSMWIYMFRFISISYKISKKYSECMSMVITEQINLYLQMEKKPEKKEELTVVNNVLKLAADLLKEIENPSKISGLGVDPWVYNATKVVTLSAFSAVMSELLGFKLKLYKIKLR